MTELLIINSSPPCQETCGMIGSQYLRCGAPSTVLVYHDKDLKAYPMCLEHGMHNVDNRGGVLVARFAR